MNKIEEHEYSSEVYDINHGPLHPATQGMLSTAIAGLKKELMTVINDFKGEVGGNNGEELAKHVNTLNKKISEADERLGETIKALDKKTTDANDERVKEISSLKKDISNEVEKREVQVKGVKRLILEEEERADTSEQRLWNKIRKNLLSIIEQVGCIGQASEITYDRLCSSVDMLKDALEEDALDEDAWEQWEEWRKLDRDSEFHADSPQSVLQRTKRTIRTLFHLLKQEAREEDTLS
jgi:hypothetical protein